MAIKTQRRSFEAGHTRKFLVIVDESPEVDAALFFAASRCQHTSGSLQLLYVIQPQAFQHWMGVRQVQLEEETNKAKALFRLFRRKLSNEGFDDIVVEDCLREGSLTDQILDKSCNRQSGPVLPGYPLSLCLWPHVVLVHQSQPVSASAHGN